MISANPSSREREPCYARTSWSSAAARAGVRRAAGPLEPDRRQERIREVFAMDAHATPPEPGRESLLQYHQYLAARLAFPFNALYFDQYEGSACDNLVTVTRLLPPPESPRAGIQCEVLAGGYPVRVRLDELRLAERSPRQQAVDDYRHWFHAQR